MSRDGKPRMTLRAEFRLGREEMARTLATAAVKGVSDISEDDLPDRLGRERILAECRATLVQFGRDAVDWWQDDAEDADAVEEWAYAMVDRAFPELAGG
jgi:hypothetical protein